MSHPSFHLMCGWNSGLAPMPLGCRCSLWLRIPGYAQRPAYSAGSPMCSSTCRHGGNHSAYDRRNRWWPAWQAQTARPWPQWSPRWHRSCESGPAPPSHPSASRPWPQAWMCPFNATARRLPPWRTGSSHAPQGQLSNHEPLRRQRPRPPQPPQLLLQQPEMQRKIRQQMLLHLLSLLSKTTVAAAARRRHKAAVFRPPHHHLRDRWRRIPRTRPQSH